MNTTRIRPMILLTAGLLWLQIGCSKEDKPSFEIDTVAIDAVSLSPVEPVQVASVRACELDADCAAGYFCFQGMCTRQCETDGDCDDGTCSERGRCVTPDATPARVVMAENHITIRPDRVQRIRPGQRTLALDLTLATDVPEGLLAWRMEDPLDPTEPTSAMRTAEGQRHFTLEIDTGAAGDPAAPQAVERRIVTAAGTFQITLIPSLSADGLYVGEAVVDALGNAAIPFGFAIVTDPPNSTLDEADAVWLQMPSEPHRLIRPEDNDLDGAWVSRPLVYDDFLRRWVATFAAPFSFSPDATLSWTAAMGVGRAIRIELEPNGTEQLIGIFSDRFTGFVDERTPGDIRTPSSVMHSGSFEVQRMGSLPPDDDVERVTPDPPVAELLPLPELSACTDGMINGVEITLADDTRLTCGGIASVADFRSAAPSEQAECARAVVETALVESTTAREITSYLDGTAPADRSFAQFLADCAAGENDTCTPPASLFCGRALAAYAQKALPFTDPAMDATLEAFSTATREAHLGRLLAAFYSDVEIRRSWLESQNFPAVVASAVQNHLESLLSEWRHLVLDVHMSVLRGRFDDAGAAVMGNPAQIEGPAADALRHQLLETTEAWRGAADAVALSARRYNVLLQSASRRAETATTLYGYAEDLYVLSALLSQWNRAAGVGAYNAMLQSGFRPVMQALNALSLPFDQLIFAREAEVVLNTSLNPSEDNDSVLSRLKASAKNALTSADIEITSLVAEARAEALEVTGLTDRLATERVMLQTELVNLCGLPEGCRVADIDMVSGCHVRTAPGDCGFGLNRESGEWRMDAAALSTSDAGQAMLDVFKASQALHTASENLRAHESKAMMSAQMTDTFAEKILEWHAARKSLDADIEQRLSDMADSQNSTFAEMAEDLSAALTGRQAALDAQEENIENWYELKLDNFDRDKVDMRTVTGLRKGAEGLRLAAGWAKSMADASAEALPTTVGTANDTTSGMRSFIKANGAKISYGLQAVAAGMDVKAAIREGEIQKRAFQESTLMTRMEQEAELSGDRARLDLETVQSDAILKAARSQAEATALNGLIELLSRQLETAQIFDRDLLELDQRRNELRGMVLETTVLESQILEAVLTVQQKMMAYQQVVQRAQMLEVRAADMGARLSNVENLVGSPSAFFTGANRLDQAEEKLERAKKALMNWLVGLEYYAVRPFMDQRISILLSRNTYQLEKIFDALSDLQESCGGPVNRMTVELSVRDDLLGLRLPVINDVDDEVLEPAERLVELLNAVSVPFDRRIRYSADSTVGDLMSRNDILALTFRLDADRFANLGSTCNAKLDGISLQVVGELGAGAMPTVSLLYDGTSQLRSCQPDIARIVETIGRDATVFGPVTAFRARGRSASPVAGVNDFPEDTYLNQTLAGLPLVSDYTLLIDPKTGGNQDFDWSALEDLRLKLVYTYQDFFPEGQCN